jgi:hypothetical protein
VQTGVRRQTVHQEFEREAHRLSGVVAGVAGSGEGIEVHVRRKLVTNLNAKL